MNSYLQSEPECNGEKVGSGARALGIHCGPVSPPPVPIYRENQSATPPASLSENEAIGEYDCVKCHTDINFGEV